ncbi:MAG: tetratricopeptide repeat protein [Betaproteobacteria bacterium]|nr:tetratricopeptide repeat protein [Betaproteobacteria bacterium]
MKIRSSGKAGWGGVRMGVGALVTCSIAAASVAMANPKLLMDATKLLADGNPKQAYMILVAEQNKLAGNLEFDYLLGVAALDSGRPSEAIIAFERVLAVNPMHAGAMMDLGRAYFTAGSLDLAESAFKQLQVSNPPDAAKAAIEKYLKAITERRSAGTRRTMAWGEVSLGYDTNITGVPNDFTRAVQSAFNIPGVEPTGNSVKRKAPFFAAAIGGDLLQPLGGNWTGHLGAEARGRGFRNEADFNSTIAEARAGASWALGRQALRFGASFNRFDQDGQAPGDPKPTNDRNTAQVTADYRYALSEKAELFGGLVGSKVTFPKNDVEDFKGVGVNAGWTGQFDGRGRPMVQVTGYFSNDRADRKLADGITDKSKRVGGLRGTVQFAWSESLALFNSVGYGERRDKSKFARATEIESGRDKLADVTLGVSWKFQPKCAMRAQWFASKNESNVAIYDYTRNEVSSNIRCDFN